MASAAALSTYFPAVSMVAGAVTSVGRLPYTSWPGPSSKHCRVTTLQSLDCSSTPGRFSSLAVHATTPAQLPGQSAEAVARLAVMGIYSYRLVVAYDGTAYSGWQLQPSAPTVQSVMEHTLSTALRECRETLKVGAAGRTDSGVHAVGQVVHFYSNHGNLESTNTVYKLNRVLPFDVRVKAIYRTASDFNATITAIGKTYHYYIDPQPEHDPMTFRYRLHHPSPLNMGVMREAAALLVGTHDFTQFSNLVKNAPKRNPIKTLQRADIVELGDGGLRIEYEGSGFLYKQVMACVAQCECSLAVPIMQIPPIKRHSKANI